MFIPIVIGALGTVTKGLIKGLKDLEIRGRAETIQTTALLRSGEESLRLEETCSHSNSCERPSALADVKNSNCSSSSSHNNSNNNLHHHYHHLN